MQLRITPIIYPCMVFEMLPSTCSVDVLGIEALATQVCSNMSWDNSSLTQVSAVKSYAPRMAQKTSTLIEELHKQSALGPVNIADWASRIAFDIMGECGLGKDFNAITSDTTHPAIQGLHENAREFSILVTVPWFLGLLAALPGGASGFITFGEYCTSQVTEKRKVCLWILFIHCPNA